MYIVHTLVSIKCSKYAHEIQADIQGKVCSLYEPVL